MSNYSSVGARELCQGVKGNRMGLTPSKWGASFPPRSGGKSRTDWDLVALTSSLRKMQYARREALVSGI